jgi:hypothetical protein
MNFDVRLQIQESSDNINSFQELFQLFGVNTYNDQDHSFIYKGKKINIDIQEMIQNIKNVRITRQRSRSNKNISSNAVICENSDNHDSTTGKKT